MKSFKLNIVSFDVPYPPNYGGVIDVYYKIKALSELGFEIYLHVYEYGRGKPIELEKYCKEIYYYSRNLTLFNFFSFVPFVVKSRSDFELIKNLNLNNCPILFEGLHTTYPLLKSFFKNRKILIRAHNIEHDYYKGLAKSEKNILKKIFFWTEAFKLKNYESILEKADNILTISPFEQSYFNKKYYHKAVYIPVFHQNEILKKFNQQGFKILYHGDLRISDNVKVVDFLIDVFSNLSFKLVIASSFENNSILKKITRFSNIDFVKLTSLEVMNNLFNETHINILLTYQKTGIKLKLINSLYQGRFIIANSEMIEDTGLEQLCEIANSKEEIISKIEKLMQLNFLQNLQQLREEHLLNFHPRKSAEKIRDLLF